MTGNQQALQPWAGLGETAPGVPVSFAFPVRGFWEGLLVGFSLFFSLFFSFLVLGKQRSHFPSLFLRVIPFLKRGVESGWILRVGLVSAVL